jgi:hypothetical protein
MTYREEAERRFPDARMLPGSGRYAVVSRCFAPPRVSLHETLARAKEVMSVLWEEGCAWWIPGHVHGCHFGEKHEIIDLRRSARRRKR